MPTSATIVPSGTAARLRERLDTIDPHRTNDATTKQVARARAVLHLAHDMVHAGSLNVLRSLADELTARAA